jgi:tyrosine decarboxylase/aspartate 1-decarboxylase
MFPEKGMRNYEVENYIAKKLRNEQSFSGRVFSSMCTQPLEISKKIFLKYIERNLVDPALFPNSVKIEQECIKLIGNLFSTQKVVGNLVSGGTEANICAILSMKRSEPSSSPEIIVPESAHISIFRAADLLSIKVKVASVDKNYRVNVDRVVKLISENTIGIIATAGTTDVGAIDPISELSQIAIESGKYLHVDAAFGGFVIPFLQKPPKIGFENEGVRSITIDPHKMGLAPIPGGCILFRNKSDWENIKYSTPYLYAQNSYGVCGTRSGASAASILANILYLGKEGYRRIVNSCISKTKFLEEELRTIPEIHVIKPTINILSFTAPSINIEKLVEALFQKGWVVSYCLKKRGIRLVIMPHTTKEDIQKFAIDLKKLIKEVI